MADGTAEGGLPLIALAGNPNTGKTTLFNTLTGSRARVGNYPGITVERSYARLQLGNREVEVVDVPGAYSLAARSGEEQIAIDAVLGRHGNPRPDLVVVVADATNVERSLYLVLQVLELGIPLLVALNLVDAAEAAGLTVDATILEEKLGAPVVPTVAIREEGVAAIRERMAGLIADPPSAGSRWMWTPAAELEADIVAVLPQLGDERPDGVGEDTARALAVWALMSIDEHDQLLDVPPALRQVVIERIQAARDHARDIDREVIEARFAWIDAEAPGFIVEPESPERSWTERVDAVLIHPAWGFVAFLAIMFLVFQSLFSWADPAITVIERLFGYLAAGARSFLPAGIVADFVSDGLIGGVGSVVVFLPQILLLFVFIGIMEDSGYMARVAFLMDRIMNRVGLHGRAFVPMLSGFACAVPAIMSTRTMERKRDRFLTMMVIPFMTCSARLPIYTLIIAALFPAATLFGIFPAQGLLMVFLYVFGTVVALVVAAVMGRTLLKGKRVPLLLELPAYRRPSPRLVGRMSWIRAKIFLKEAGTVILVCAVVLWALLYFPRDSDEARRLKKEKNRVTALAKKQGHKKKKIEAQSDAYDARIKGAQLRNSAGGRMGRFIEPALEPLGFDWKVGVGIIGAFAAREVFISTMGVVYGIGGEVDETNATLRARIRAEKRSDGKPVYTPLMGFSLMIFFALACQCMSTLAVVKRETNSYRWPIFMFVYMTILAWVVSFLIYQGGRLLGLG